MMAPINLLLYIEIKNFGSFKALFGGASWIKSDQQRSRENQRRNLLM